MIAPRSVEEIEFNETDDLFFHRLGECKLPSLNCCFAISKHRGVVFIGTGTGASILNSYIPTRGCALF